MTGTTPEFHFMFDFMSLTGIDAIKTNINDSNSMPSVHRVGAVFPSLGEINHAYSLPLEQIQMSLEANDETFEKLVETNHTESDLEIVRTDKDQAWNLLTSMCDAKGKSKRNPVLIGALIVVAFVAVVGAVVAIVVEATKSEPITAETLKMDEEINDLEKDRESLEMMKIRTLANDTNLFREIFRKHQITSHLSHHYKRDTRRMKFMVNPGQWDYKSNEILSLAEENVGKTGKFAGRKIFGTSSLVSFLLLSTATTDLYRENNVIDCGKNVLVTKFRTIIPTEEPAFPTKNPYKFSISNGRFAWMSPNSFLLKTNFRAANLLSSQRQIISVHSNVSFLPLNNTQIIVRTPPVTANVICPESFVTIKLNGSKLMSIPHRCELVSDFFNISIYSQTYLKTESLEENMFWKMRYHTDLEKLHEKTNDKDLKNTIEHIWSLKDEEIKIEEKAIQKSGISYYFSVVNDFFMKWENIVIIFGVAILIIFGLISLSYIYKSCVCKQ